jgi:hypothetical protein
MWDPVGTPKIYKCLSIFGRIMSLFRKALTATSSFAGDNSSSVQKSDVICIQFGVVERYLFDSLKFKILEKILYEKTRGLLMSCLILS